MMHKKRLRKKLGKKYKIEIVNRETVNAAMKAAIHVSAGAVRASILTATFSTPGFVKCVALAENAINTMMLSTKAFKAVEKYKKMDIEQHYRMHFNYPTAKVHP